MAQTLSVDEWLRILKDPGVTLQENLDLFHALYRRVDHQAAASDLGAELGFVFPERKARSAPLNGIVGRHGDRISDAYGVSRTIREYSKRVKSWDLFFDGHEKGGLFIWRLKPELAAALERGGFVETAAGLASPDEIAPETAKTLIEGAVKQIVVNAYERNPAARAACIAHHGAACAVCGLDFAKRYGPHGAGYIHVHHLKPLSEIGERYKVDPVKDLIPVCPNCHAMIHHRGGLLSIKDLKAMLRLLSEDFS